MRKAYQRGLLAAGVAAAAGAFVAAALTPATVRDVSLSFEGGRLAIGTLALPPLVGAAWAQSADTVTLDNVAFEVGTTRYRLPRVEFVGVNLSQGEVAALVQAGAAASLPARLARLSAKTVRIPELTVEQRIGDQRQVATYRDVVARDIVDGRVAQAAAAGAEVEITGRGAGSGRYGRLSLDAVDMPELARLVTETAEGPPGPLKRIYGRVAVEDVAFKDAKGVEIAIARMSATDLSARPTKESWAQSSQVAAALQDWAKATESDRSRAVAALADLFDAFAIGGAEISGFSLRGGPENTTSRIARIAYAGASAGTPAQVRMEGVEAAGKNGRIRLASVDMTGFSLKPTLDGLQALARKPTANLSSADLRSLMPVVGTIRLRDVDFEASDDRAKGQRQARSFAVRGVEVTGGAPLNGVPTSFRLGMDGVSFDIPPKAEEAGLKDLLAMGYRRLDLSWTASASWNEPGNELVVREITLQGADMGSVTIRGVLGSVSKDVFDPDAAIATVALVGATAKTMDVSIENKGLFERVIAQEARRQKKSPEELRREYGVAAAVAVPAMLGGSPAAKAIGQAVARFVAKPGRLTVAARTKDPVGLGLADVAAIAEPAGVLDKLDVTATAE